MKLKATIKVQRKDLGSLYDWLDANAHGWASWGSATSGELSQEKTRQILLANLMFMERMVEYGLADKWSTIEVVLPDKKSAMLCKLAWIHSDVEKPPLAPCSD